MQASDLEAATSLELGRLLRITTAIEVVAALVAVTLAIVALDKSLLICKDPASDNIKASTSKYYTAVEFQRLM